MNRVHLNRLLSKRGVLTRSQATTAILEGRVSVNGRVVRDPAQAVDPESARIEVDGNATAVRGWTTLLFHKPRGVITTRRDPEGRPTIYDVLGENGQGLIPVGRLDRATSGVLLLTSDTELAHRLTDPASAIARVYAVSVRGRVTDEERARLEEGIVDRGETLKADEVILRKASGRESHLVVTLREGKNREVRRLLGAVGHDVTKLKRVAFGSFTLGDLAPGQWRDVSKTDVRAAFPEMSGAVQRVRR